MHGAAAAGAKTALRSIKGEQGHPELDKKFDFLSQLGCPLWHLGHKFDIARLRSCERRTHARSKRWLGVMLVQAGALLISHIAPGSRTLAPSA